MIRLLWFCFTVSGAAALALETLWMRSAGLVLGQTALTTATVLACYFAGLSLGAAGARGVQEHAVRWYGIFEIGASAGALWSIAVFRMLSTDTAQQWLVRFGTAGCASAVAVAVLPATLCLGATLPAVGQALSDTNHFAGRSAALYALNTLGGALGIAAAGFGLPALVGVRVSYGIAAGASALAGVIALVIATQNRFARGADFDSAASTLLPEPPKTTRARIEASVVSRARLRIVATGAGALALALEVLWTRLFAQVLHNSVYSFSAVALVFLLAIAFGAALAALLLRRALPTVIAASALVSAALGTIGGVWLFVRWTDGLAYVGMHSGLGEYILRIVALAAVTAGPAAVASGILLPSLWAAFGDADSVARPLGDLSAVNTAGGIFGALAAGFVAIPLLGVRGAFLATAVAYVILAYIISPNRRSVALGAVGSAQEGPRYVRFTHYSGKRSLGDSEQQPFPRVAGEGCVSRGSLLPKASAAALIIIAIFNPLRAPLIHLRPEAETLRAMIEGPSGIVSVVESDGDRQLRLDNYYVLGGTAAATNERRLGLLPLLLHPNPQRVAFIGLATGITASAGPALGVYDTTVVELIPEVADAARAHFGSWNGQLLDRPDVHLVVDDGRRYLATSREPFDAIVSDLFIPWHAGAGSLYSREIYQAIARRLAPGGLFCQWLPLYQLTREEFDLITRTFLAVFPQTSLWRADFFPNRPVVGLIAQTGARQVDLERVRDRLYQLPDESRDQLLATTRGLVMLYAGDLSSVADLFPGEALNTDDRPLLEFAAPRLTRFNATGDKDWFTGTELAAFYVTLDHRLSDAPDPLFAASEAVTAARRAGTALVNYALAATSGDTGNAARLQAEVQALVPEVIVGAESTDTTVDLADARRTLNGLRSEQEEVRRRIAAIEQRLGTHTQQPDSTPSASK